MIRPCTSEFLLATPDGLGLGPGWFPRVVAEAFLKSTRDGEIKRAPDPVTMISGDLTWYNETNDRQSVAVQVVRAPRSVVSQSPSTVVIHDAWSFDVGASPSAVAPTVMQDTFGGKCQVDRDSVAPDQLKYGRVFYDSDATQSWVNIGLVEPGQALHFRYIAACQTPGVWTQADSDTFQSRWEAQARYTRLVAVAMPWSISGDEIPQYLTSLDVKHPAGVYSYFAPASLGPGDPLDVVLLGGGGGGEGDRWDQPPAGGLAAAWETATLVFGTDFDASTRFDVNVGKGGKGGAWSKSGSDGEATIVTWTTPTGTLRTLKSAGGPGGSAGTEGHYAASNRSWGQSPGNKTFNSRVYPGGAAVQPTFFQSGANPPGGGGPAGGFMQYGMAGADGVAVFNGAPTPPPQELEEFEFTTPGTYDIVVPAWATKADLVGVGGGGGGGAGPEGNNDVPGGVIDGPSMGIGEGHPGGATQFSVDNVSVLFAQGGTGAAGTLVPFGSTAYRGQSPGNYNWNDIPYAGGISVDAKQKGSPPGGGGGGGEILGLYAFGGGAGQWAGKTIDVIPGSVIRVRVSRGGLPNGYSAALDRGRYHSQQGAAGAGWVRLMA